jgi:hypothetical protein
MSSEVVGKVVNRAQGRNVQEVYAAGLQGGNLLKSTWDGTSIAIYPSQARQ